ncbi:MAG: DUF4230 domain-containing protein [Bacteroidota bacterium]
MPPQSPEPVPHEHARIRRFHADEKGPSRSPLRTGAILIGSMAAMVILAYYLFGRHGGIHTDVIDFSKTMEQIQELSSVRSHFRFGVVVREESGNIIVRRLADQVEAIGMDGLGNALFQDPTMFVELHGVATYGIRLQGLAGRITQDDSTVHIPIPRAEVLDAKLISADTKIVATMKGLFRSSNNQLLLEANRRGEEFTRDYATQDTTMMETANRRLRDILSLLVERSGKRAIFE